jgi:hypothetical protein
MWLKVLTEGAAGITYRSHCHNRPASAVITSVRIHAHTVVTAAWPAGLTFVYIRSRLI